MTLRVSGKNLAIGEALRTHVHSRIGGVVAKYHAGAPIGHVTIEPEGSGYRADCTLFLKAGFTLQVEAVAQEPYASFDKAADRVERRLRDHRKRVQDRHSTQNGASGQIAATEPAGDDLASKRLGGDGFAGDGFPGVRGPGLANEGEDASDLFESEADASDEDGGSTFAAIVAEPVQTLGDMTVAAAARALDEGSCPVVVFRVPETKRVNVVYRRSDGNIGWIDPLLASNGHSA